MKRINYYILIDEARNEAIFGSTSPNPCERALLEQSKKGVKCKISILNNLGEYHNVKDSRS